MAGGGLDSEISEILGVWVRPAVCVLYLRLGLWLGWPVCRGCRRAAWFVCSEKGKLLEDFAYGSQKHFPEKNMSLPLERSWDLRSSSSSLSCPYAVGLGSCVL